MTPIPIPVHIVGTPTPSDMLSPTQYLNYEAGSGSSVSFMSILAWGLLLAVAAVILYVIFHIYKDVICPKCPPCVQKLASRYMQVSDKESELLN